MFAQLLHQNEAGQVHKAGGSFCTDGFANKKGSKQLPCAVRMRGRWTLAAFSLPANKGKMATDRHQYLEAIA